MPERSLRRRRSCQSGLGSTCAKAEDCASGNCVDGVCCNESSPLLKCLGAKGEGCFIGSDCVSGTCAAGTCD